MAEEYVNLIIENIKKVKIGECEDKELNKIRKEITPIIQLIIDNNREYMLTKDYCLYVVVNCATKYRRKEDFRTLLKNSLKTILNDNPIYLVMLKGYYIHNVINDISTRYRQYSACNIVVLMDDSTKAIFHELKGIMYTYDNEKLEAILCYLFGSCFTRQRLDLVIEYADRFANDFQEINDYININFPKGADRYGYYLAYLVDSYVESMANEK